MILKAYALFGNPVEHSKSPEIYALFANEMKIIGEYDLKLVSKKNFDTSLFDFFNSGGLGANITAPFKERALFLCDHLTENAIIANSVNTIKKINDNTLLGDNTDGVGLINDLKRLKWIDHNNTLNNDNNDDDNKKIMANILIIGAGGAAQGIIFMLLNIKECYINIINRTLSKAKKLVRNCHSIGLQNISYFDYADVSNIIYNKKIYDLIINATSSSIYNEIPKIPSSFINSYTKCYDLFYQKKDTIFIKWCKQNGSHYCSDGLGMLVEQAAYAFNLWHNFLPSTVPVLNYLKSTFHV